MKSRVQSDVHLMTANIPSTRVQCHRPIPHSIDSSSRNPSVTNEFLKKGGSLPSVLPAGDHIAGSLVEPLNDNYFTRGKPNSSKNKCSVILNRKRTEARNKKHSTMEPVNNVDMIQLEKKMEHLSSKLSMVHEILQNQKTDAVGQTQHPHRDADKNELFSARDYTFLLLEMNGNVPAEPYNPNDFSEKAA